MERKETDVSPAAQVQEIESESGKKEKAGVKVSRMVFGISNTEEEKFVWSDMRTGREVWSVVLGRVRGLVGVMERVLLHS